MISIFIFSCEGTFPTLCWRPGTSTEAGGNWSISRRNQLFVEEECIPQLHVVHWDCQRNIPYPLFYYLCKNRVYKIVLFFRKMRNDRENLVFKTLNFLLYNLIFIGTYHQSNSTLIKVICLFAILHVNYFECSTYYYYYYKSLFKYSSIIQPTWFNYVSIFLKWHTLP